MPRVPLFAVAALLAALVAQSAGAVVKGDERVLVVLATSGSKPYTVADVERTGEQARSFISEASFGQVKLQIDVTPWLAAFTANPGCGSGTNRSLDNVVAPARIAADLAGFDSTRYDDVIYTIADSHCGFHGTTWGNEVMLTRQPNLQLVVHELGHAFGLGHAQASDCVTGEGLCGLDETGDPFSPMGHGQVDFSTYEKVALGWIRPQPHVTAAKRYVLAPPTATSKLAQALIVDTAAGAWWIEYRSQPFRGLLFRFVSNEVVPSPFEQSAALITRLTKFERPWLERGETYRIPGSFRVTLTKAAGGRAEVRFR
ncbi:MAG: hypothetical protein QOE13_446 [Gaiellaceae bacterium]|nr:hypothetical protein [Gaiellaceae bacterium]